MFCNLSIEYSSISLKLYENLRIGNDRTFDQSKRHEISLTKRLDSE